MNPLIPGCLMRVMGQLVRRRLSASSPAGALRQLAAALLAGLTSAAVFAPPVRATTITVSTTADENNSNGDCSLREAVIAANQDQAQGACAAGNGADTIKLPAGTYVLTIIGTFENASLTGDLDIASDLTIDGAGQGDTEIDGNGTDRVLHILSGTVTVSDLTIANGDPGAENGGGLLNFGDVTIEDSRIRDCAADSGGAIHMATGTLTVIGSRIDGNTAEDGGAILFSATSVVVHIIDSVISGNTATQGNGGAIFNSGITSLSNSTVSGNSAAKSGGGILTIGLQAAQVIMFSTTIANNTADSDGDGDGDGGGIHAPPLGTFNARNSLFGNNRDLSPSGDVFPDCSGVLFGVGYNLIENVAGCILSGTQVGNVTGLDPNLGPLQGNGGGTLTRELLGGSPAINAGNPLDCIGPNGIVLDTDQRGSARKGRCDIGAFEFDSDGTPTPADTATRTVTPTRTVTRTRTSTARATATRTFRPTRDATSTVTPTRRVTRTATAAATHTFTSEPSPTASLTRTRTPTHTASFTATRTPTATPSAPPPTVTGTASPTAPGAASPTNGLSVTPTGSPTATAAVTKTHTSAVAESATSTPTPLLTPPATPTVDKATTATPSPIATAAVTPTHTKGSAATPTPTFTPIPTSECPGDCDDDGTVRIDELLRGVNIALNALSVVVCPAFDTNRNAAVQIDDLVAGVNAALHGCGAPGFLHASARQSRIPRAS